MAGKYRTRKEKLALYRKLAAACGAFFAVCLIVVVVFGSVDSQGSEGHSEQETEPEGLTFINGESYIPKKNIETYLFMGIDNSGKVGEKSDHDGTGQCDVLILLVRDLSKGTYRTLPLDRNTMTDVKSLDTDGTYLATTRDQLALAHASGDGLEASCENVVDAVSGFLLGQKIDGYAAIHMGAIRTVNHLLGGVDVVIEDDFSETDPSLIQGETVHLTDEQAFHYIHDRMNVGDGTNEGRMRRQSAYMDAAEPLLKQKCQEDSGFPMELYEALGDYMVTDIPANKFSKIALLVSKEKNEGKLSIEGTSRIGDFGLVEFEADETSVGEAVSQLFYKKYE